MPRRARILLPHTPHHVVQRGHNRASVFAEASDYRYYVETVIEWKQTLRVKVYAYCLMTNHVHIIVEPGEAVLAVGKLMRRLAGRQTRLANALKGRTGTLWSIEKGSEPKCFVKVDSELKHFGSDPFCLFFRPRAIG